MCDWSVYLMMHLPSQDKLQILLLAQSGHWPAQRPLCARTGRFQHQHALTGGEQILLHSHADSPESSRAFFRG